MTTRATGILWTRPDVPRWLRCDRSGIETFSNPDDAPQTTEELATYLRELSRMVEPSHRASIVHRDDERVIMRECLGTHTEPRTGREVEVYGAVSYRLLFEA